MHDPEPEEAKAPRYFYSVSMTATEAAALFAGLNHLFSVGGNDFLKRYDMDKNALYRLLRDLESTSEREG